MAEYKNTEFNRPGGYAQPKGSTQIQRKAAKQLTEADIRLYGDSVQPHKPLAASRRNTLQPTFSETDPDTHLYIGDCRDVLASLPEKGQVDLIFADPPFNWEVPYAGDSPEQFTTASTENTEEIKSGAKARRHEGTKNGKTKKPSSVNSVSSVVEPNGGSGAWNDAMPRAEYERFTFDWLDGCIECLAPHGSLWVNVPDDTAAEVVLHLKRRGLTMINWCIWHFRFGQNRNSSFIMSKVHVLYFAKSAEGLGEKGTKARRHGGTKGNAVGDNGDAANHSVPSCLRASVPSAGRIWNPNDILELSDRATIYFDKRTMAKDENKGLRVPMDVWYGKYWGRIQGNNKERRHSHHNQIPEIYLERVIKACSNPGSLVLDPFCGSGTTSTVARALGRKSITIEYSEVNAKSAWERITKVGMVPREDAGKPQSSAIFKSRKRQQTLGTSA